MPDDRFLHRKAGHGQKPNQLGSDEYRVWTQYILSADDFGVMRASAVTLMSDNDFLEEKTEKQVQRWLEAVISIGLLHVFEHQGRRYAFQHDWQTWQKVNYPRATNNPKPPAECLSNCDEATRRLFAQHPGGAGRTRKECSENVLGTVQEDLSLMRGRGHAKRLTANSKRLTANGSDAPAHASFDRFWAEYPRKTAKSSALKVWVGLAPDEALVAEILAAVRVQAAQPQWTKDGGQFIPHASTWLNNKRWQDQVGPVAAPQKGDWYGHIPHCRNESACVAKWLEEQREKEAAAS